MASSFFLFSILLKPSSVTASKFFLNSFFALVLRVAFRDLWAMSFCFALSNLMAFTFLIACVASASRPWPRCSCFHFFSSTFAASASKNVLAICLNFRSFASRSASALFLSRRFSNFLYILITSFSLFSLMLEAISNADCLLAALLASHISVFCLRNRCSRLSFNASSTFLSLRSQLILDLFSFTSRSTFAFRIAILSLISTRDISSSRPTPDVDVGSNSFGTFDLTRASATMA
mmetsp:Transcript_12135/g.22127  ORF Transcript_12135/g.22127 Transcript_12135/m.22127 type:complete len:234 (+) Transcript_12135:229-930(+)